MRDMQSEHDDRGIAIDRVGVCDLKLPVKVLQPDGTATPTVASLTLSVDLPREFKGTHMSRFIAALAEHSGEMTIRTLPALLNDLRSRLNASTAHARLEFPYFVTKSAPVSGASALMEYTCGFEATQDDAATDFLLHVDVPVTTVCPCSKEISDYGAHNQRATLALSVRPERTAPHEFEWVWLEELIALAERSGSSPVYALLKRIDERHVTMAGYDNPMFVEDVVRALCCALQADRRIAWFRIRAVTQESIHNHNAFAELTSSGRSDLASELEV